MFQKLIFGLVILVTAAGLQGATDETAAGFAIRWLALCTPGCPSTPFGFTENGVISGNLFTAEGERGFLLDRDGRLTMVDTPGNVFIELLKGNNRGEFVGAFFSPADSLVHAFVRSRNGEIRSFIYPRAAVTVAGGITNQGDVVGSFTSDPTTAAGWVSFVERNGSFPLLFQFPDPNSSGTIALGINEAGTIVGVFTRVGSATLHAFERTKHGGFLEIAFPAAQETYLADINESGTATGYWRDQSGAYHGLLFANDMCRSIDTPPGPSGFRNTVVTGINNSGEMVGVSFAAVPGDGDGFLMTPHAGNHSSVAVASPPVRCAVATH
jgi:hypothetical protein